MNILVTGAAGFIGSHLSEALNQSGHHIIGLDNFNSYYHQDLKKANAQQLKQQGMMIHTIDLAQDYLIPFVQSADYIFHLAAQPGISATTPFSDYERNNLQATYRLLEAALQAPHLKGFINIATSSVYGEDATGDESTEPRPTSFYGVTKLAAEQLVMSYARSNKLPACSLRLFSVYGPRERPEKLYPKLIHSIFSNQAFPLHEGSQDHLRSYTYVGDIVKGLIGCMQHFRICNGEIINIGTDVCITTAEGIALIEKIIGKKAQVITKPKRPGDQLKTHAHIEKARRLFNYHPSITPETGLAKEVEWYKTHIYGTVKPYEHRSTSPAMVNHS
jgi:UDP-glucuronate 4-epimerase